MRTASTVYVAPPVTHDGHRLAIGGGYAGACLTCSWIGPRRSDWRIADEDLAAHLLQGVRR